jgi:hypothetical protein
MLIFMLRTQFNPERQLKEDEERGGQFAKDNPKRVQSVLVTADGWAPDKCTNLPADFEPVYKDLVLQAAMAGEMSETTTGMRTNGRTLLYILQEGE